MKTKWSIGPKQVAEALARNEQGLGVKQLADICRGQYRPSPAEAAAYKFEDVFDGAVSAGLAASYIAYDGYGDKLHLTLRGLRWLEQAAGEQAASKEEG